MSEAVTPAPPRGLLGFLDALRDGQVVVGWAADPQDRTVRPLIRLMRGLEVLAEGVADVAREDGNPGFRLRAPMPLTPADFLEGRLRVRAVLPGRQAATTLAMTRRMREQLEAMAGWGPTTDFPDGPAASMAPDTAADIALAAASLPVPPPPAPAPMPAPAPAPMPAPAPATVPPPPPVEVAAPVPAAPPKPPAVAPGWTPRPAEAAPQPAPLPEGTPPAAPPELPFPLGTLQDLARQAAAARVPVLHLLVPARGSVLGGGPANGLAPLEELAAARPLLAQDWVPLRHAFARLPNPGVLWRHNGHGLTVEGGLAVLTTLLAVLQLRRPEAAAGLARAAALVARADLATLPRREIPAEPGDVAGLSFLGVAVGETEPALTAAIFADQPPPRPVGEVLPGLEAWSAAGAPLPWRVVLLAEPDLGGSAHPARLGWWLRWLVAECVISEALHIARPEAVLGAQPDLVLTLAAEPR
ncbi:hypothetical protein [Falsiroseomonas sp.]|uniref:hypothetical protein n=1 Tax=Falsiroseomonas sp. TaxID=2870721 RepID=UPI003F717AF6